jgi:hypothetical protein
MSTSKVKVTKKQLGILRHAVENRQFYTNANDPDVVSLVDMGLIKKICDGWTAKETCFGITAAGKDFIK